MGTSVARELKHVVVREHVRELLRGADPGTPAPSERELVSQFGVARMTVRQALDALVGDGLLERIPGRGTFVAPPRARMVQVASFTEAMSRRGRVAESRTLLARMEQAGPGVSRALEIETGQLVVHWRRLRHCEGQVIALQDVYLCASIFGDLLDTAMPSSLYALLDERGMRPTWAEDSLHADLPTSEERELLDIGEGQSQAVLRAQRRALVHDRVVEVSRSVYRSDRFTLYAQVGEWE